MSHPRHIFKPTDDLAAKSAMTYDIEFVVTSQGDENFFGNFLITEL